MKNCSILLGIIAAVLLSVHAQELRSLTGHSGGLPSIAYSPDGKTFVSGSMDSTIKLWDAATGNCLRTMAGHTDSVADVMYSPDGKYIVSGSWDKTVKIWDSSTGMCIRTLTGHTSEVRTVAWSPNGSLIVSGSMDTTIKIWNAVTGVCIRTITGHGSIVNSVAFSPDGRWIVSGSDDRTVKIWNATTGAVIKALMGHSGFVTAVAYSPDGATIASGSADKTVKIWDVVTGNCIKTLTGHSRVVNSVSFAPDGKTLLSGSDDATVKIWDTSTGTCIRTLTGHKTEVWDAVYSPDGKVIVSASADRTVKMWSLSLAPKIRAYVESKINVWQKKDEYEKTSEYKARVNDDTRKQKIQEFTNEIVAQLKEQFIATLNWGSYKVLDYDADNESYRIILPDGQETVLAVPRPEAKDFKNNVSSLKFMNVVAAIDGETMKIAQMTIKNPSNNKMYTYDSKVPVVYNASNIQYNFEEVQVDVPQDDVTTNSRITSTTTVVGKADVDTQLPATSTVNPDAVAIIIGNKNYKKTKSVDFALNDVQVMKEYLVKVFGYKEGNILVVPDATKGDFETMFGTDNNYKGKLYNMIKQGTSDVFIYYVGHGAPSVNTKKGYFVPVECDPQYVDLGGYSIDTFYANCAKLNPKSMTIVLDACFSGADLLKNISPMIIEVNNPVVDMDNTIVFASSSGSQVSTWYNEKGHSMFTYFFLKGIHSKAADMNKDGKITVTELYDYISNNNEGVPYYARRLHGIDQTPTVEGKDRSKVIVTY